MVPAECEISLIVVSDSPGLFQFIQVNFLLIVAAQRVPGEKEGRLIIHVVTRAITTIKTKRILRS